MGRTIALARPYDVAADPVSLAQGGNYWCPYKKEKKAEEVPAAAAAVQVTATCTTQRDPSFHTCTRNSPCALH